MMAEAGSICWFPVVRLNSVGSVSGLLQAQQLLTASLALHGLKAVTLCLDTTQQKRSQTMFYHNLGFHEQHIRSVQDRSRSTILFLWSSTKYYAYKDSIRIIAPLCTMTGAVCRISIAPRAGSPGRSAR